MTTTLAIATTMTLARCILLRAESHAKGSSSQVMRDGLMYVQVTTFDPADMKFK